MISQSYLIYEQLDASKKDAKWADRSISSMRQWWRNVVDPARMRENKQYLFSQHDLEYVRKTFKDKKFLETTSFNPLGLLESIRNSLAEEMIKFPPTAELKATDPTAISDKKEDIQLLKNRKIVEKDISKYNKQVGLPPHKVGYDKFHGNVEQFDKMGLNESDPDDVNFFEENIQRLDYEIAGQSLLNNVFKLARFDEETVKRFIDDALAAKVNCMQAYVDQMTGEIKLRYVYPETAMGILGDANDGKDDICRGWQDAVTVLEWLQMVGNSFDFEKHWKHLLWAINFCMGYKFTGFVRNNYNYDVCGTSDEGRFREDFGNGSGKNGALVSNTVDWTMAYTYKIYIGYIEWNTAEATSTFLKNHGDSTVAELVPYNFELSEKEKVKGYYTESFYQQQWYRSYFIATTSISQWIYGFQKVYHQPIEGANDEYAAGTCIFYRQEGMSAVEIVKEFIKMVELTWYKIKWLVFKSKPQEEEYLYNELIEIVKGLQNQYPQSGTNKAPSILDQIQQVLEFNHANHIRIRFFPQVDGKTDPHVPVMPERKNGLDVLAISLQGIFEWAKSYIAQEIGWNPIRSGANPMSRQPVKSIDAAVQASQKSTGYFYRMIQFTQENLATRILLYAQDIIRYEDTLPFNWIKRIVGNEEFQSLGILKNFAAHRFGLFVRDYNATVEKKNIDDAATMSLQQKEIQFDQWFLVTQTVDPKKAAKLLAYQKLKADKKMRNRQIQDMQMQHNFKMQEIQAETNLENIKGKWRLDVAKEEGKHFDFAANRAADSKIKVKEIGVEHEPEKAASKGEANKDLAITKSNLENQKAYPAK